MILLTLLVCVGAIVAVALDESPVWSKSQAEQDAEARAETSGGLTWYADDPVSDSEADAREDNESKWLRRYEGMGLE